MFRPPSLPSPTISISRLPPHPPPRTVRKDLLGNPHPHCPEILDFTVMSKTFSMPNTPCTWRLAVVLRGWEERHTGLSELSLPPPPPTLRPASTLPASSSTGWRKRAAWTVCLISATTKNAEGIIPFEELR